MNKSLNKENYSKLINFTYGVTKVFYRISFVCAIIVAVCMILGFILPQNLFFSNASTETIDIEIGRSLVYTLEIQVGEGGDVKTIGLSALAIGLVYLSFIAFFLRSLKNILVEVKEKNPFSKVSIKNIYILAITIIVGSVILPIAEFIIGYILIHQLNLNNIDAKMSVDTNMLFIGLLILVLASIFNYGAHLQNEYDQIV